MKCVDVGPRATGSKSEEVGKGVIFSSYFVKPVFWRHFGIFPTEQCWQASNQINEYSLPTMKDSLCGNSKSTQSCVGVCPIHQPQQKPPCVCLCLPVTRDEKCSAFLSHGSHWRSSDLCGGRKLEKGWEHREGSGEGKHLSNVNPGTPLVRIKQHSCHYLKVINFVPVEYSPGSFSFKKSLKLFMNRKMETLLFSR